MDWFRNEYILPLTKVDGFNYKPVCRNNPKDLISSFSEGQLTKIRPFGKNYLPAWLTIFPNIKNDQKQVGSSQINASGVNLDLEIIQFIEDNSPLQNDGTILEFVPSNDFLKVTPSKIKLSDLISKRKNDRILDFSTQRIEYYYENSKVINVKYQGGVLNKHEEIVVFSYRNNGEKEKVGKLMVYRNNDIPKLDLFFINVITDNVKINKPNAYQYYLKYQSFNQALIRAEMKLDTDFNLVTLAQNNPEIQKFLNEVNDPLVLSRKKALSPSYLSKKLLYLFDKYGGKYRPNDGKNYLQINKDGHARTYIFYTNLIAGTVNGFAPPQMDSNNKEKWGNGVIVFKQAQVNLDTLVHEIGHTLGLPHIFERGDGNKYVFYQGQTGNIMDYTWFDTLTKKYGGKNSRLRLSFSKFQWDILRSDRSLK